MKEKTFGAVTVVFGEDTPFIIENDIAGLCKSYDPYTCMIDDLKQMKFAEQRNQFIKEELKRLGVVTAICKDIDMPSGKMDFVLFGMIYNFKNKGMEYVH